MTDWWRAVVIGIPTALLIAVLRLKPYRERTKQAWIYTLVVSLAVGGITVPFGFLLLRGLWQSINMEPEATGCDCFEAPNGKIICERWCGGDDYRDDPAYQ